MSDEDLARLQLEPCEVCKKSIPLVIKKSTIKPSITGVSTVIDIHGIDNKDDIPEHVRILYVDENFSVRSYSVVSSIAKRAEKD